MHVFDMAAPFDDADGGAMAGMWPDLIGLDATPGEISALYGALSELDAMDDAELDALAAEAADADRDAWMDDLPDEQFRQYMGEVRDNAADPGAYLDMARGIDSAIELSGLRDHTRRQQDADERARRGGARSQRPSDELILSNAMNRYQDGTYLPNQLPPSLDFSNEFDELQYTGPAATRAEVYERMSYELGGGLPPGRARRDPLPDVHTLGKTIGLW